MHSFVSEIWSNQCEHTLDLGQEPRYLKEQENEDKQIQEMLDPPVFLWEMNFFEKITFYHPFSSTNYMNRIGLFIILLQVLHFKNIKPEVKP